jgi:hypothetical protein
MKGLRDKMIYIIMQPQQGKTVTLQHQQHKIINWFIRSNHINLLKPTGYVMHHQFNFQQLYVLLARSIYVLYLSENKQRLVPRTTSTDPFL